jgi:hypothetical protein
MSSDEQTDTSKTLWRPWYRMIQWSASLVLLLLLLAGFVLGRFQPPMGQLAFCAFGVLTGAAFARMAHPLDGRLTRLGWVALGFVVSSEVFFQLLVWSESWRVQSLVLGWRLWWGTVVMAVGLGWLQVLWRAGARWEWNSGRTTLGFTAGLGALLIGLAFRANPFSTLPAWWHWAATALAVGATGGSLVIIGRWLKKRPKNTRPLPRWMGPALRAVGLGALCAGSFYFGRLTVPPPSPFDTAHSMLAAVPAEVLEQQLNRDSLRLKKLAEGMKQLGDDSDALHKRIVVRMKAAGTEEYLPGESREIQHLFIQYIDYRNKLIQLARVYIGFKKVQDETLRDRCFLTGYGAAAMALEAGLTYVEKYRDDDLARAKLNEGKPGWLKPDQFEIVYHSVTDRQHLKLFETYGAHFKKHSERWRHEGLPGTDIKWLEGHIQLGQAAVESADLDPVREWFSRIGRQLEQDVNVPFYEAQKMMASFMGDTRIVRREPFISEHLIQMTLKDPKTKLLPGDIILERRNWYLSNAFLPGFWPHCALYVGTPEELEAVGIEYSELDAEARAAHQRLEHGRPSVIIEAMSEGVVFTSAEHSMHADYVAVLRPRNFSDDQIATVIRNAFRYHGRAYDFAFDFADESKLVCSELLYYSFGDLMKFKLEPVLGKSVVTPVGIMNKYVNERGTPAAQLEFVLFLDTRPGKDGTHIVYSAPEEACCESATRPKIFNE